jgi:hypothetical protein
MELISFTLFAMSNETCFSLLFSFTIFLIAPWFYSLFFLNEWRWQEFFLDLMMNDSHWNERIGGISGDFPDFVWLAMDGVGRWPVHDRYFFAKRLKVWENSTQNLSSKNSGFIMWIHMALVDRICPKERLGFLLFWNKSWSFPFIMNKSKTSSNYIISLSNVR